MKYVFYLSFLINAINVINTSNNSSVLDRSKRQYFKPSIDGSWLSNERALLLRRIRTNRTNTNHTNGFIKNGDLTRDIVGSVITWIDKIKIALQKLV